MTRHRRRSLCLAGCLLALTGCSKARSSASRGPAGGDGRSEVARIDRSNPRSGVIVVLGSSTSAGAGASAPERAWVPLYRAHLARHFPHFVIVNLAVSGYTTFHIQPSSYEPPKGRPGPASGQNIDAALALRPRAIVVNLPSNDQAAGYDWHEQRANYERVAAAAANDQVPLWVTTTQPRNFPEGRRRRELELARDALRQRFGARATDFWSPLAQPDGTIKRELDSGDGIHLNDAGHAALARIVIEAMIPEVLLAQPPAPDAPPAPPGGPP